jgi:hypothetical protein
MRSIIAVLALAAAPVAVADAGNLAAARPPIEDSYIVAPRQMAGYSLANTVNYADQGHLLAGIGLRYRDALQPTMTTDIYIYPAGDGEALSTTEQNFRESMQVAAQRGLYSEVRWGESTPYALHQRDGGAWPGRMIAMQVRYHDGDFASRTYLFHHGIYDYKLRIDLPAAQAGELPAAADALVRAVLPAIQVVNTGGCGREMVVIVLKPDEAMPAGFVDSVAPDGFGIAVRESERYRAGQKLTVDADSDPDLLELARRAGERQLANGCTVLPYTPPATDEYAVLKLHYPADFWKASSRP